MVHASPASAKVALRAQMRDLRKRLAAETPDAAERAAANLPLERLTPARVVAGYRPRGTEFDPWPVMALFENAGAQLALPVALDRDSPLRFRAYRAGDPLAPDAFNILAPIAEAPTVAPDLLIAPLLAFDGFGHRMGRGAGHYDRTLAALRRRGTVFALGLAYAGQRVARVPAEAHDQRLDAILTEIGYIEVA